MRHGVIRERAGMKVLVTGGGGQVATALQATAPPDIQLQALARSELDITDKRAVRRVVDIAQPQVVINAAAYTGVDQAEKEPEQAHAVNAEGAGHVAEAAQAVGARIIHLSTDFVFDGVQPRPYAPDDPPRPLGVYGASKLAGEQAVMRAAPEAFVLRTAWVYAERGHNFVHTVLRLCAEKPELRIVMDQLGSPTWAFSIAGALWEGIAKGTTGVHHWTDAGVASRYDFAVSIQEEAVVLGLLRQPVPIYPIRSAEYPTPARRPAYSVLDTRSFQQATGLVPAYWRDNLRRMLRNLHQGAVDPLAPEEGHQSPPLPLGEGS